MGLIWRASLAQINTTVGDLSGNREKVLRALEKARDQKSHLVVFPELTLTGYPPEDLLFKERFVTDNIKVLKSILPYTRGLAAVVGFVDRDRDGRLYNAAAFILNKRIIHVYRKVELPNYGVFDEKRYFAPGNEGAIIDFPSGPRIGLTICEDIWQTAGYVYSEYSSADVSLLINISASPYHMGKQRQREALLKGLALKTGAVILYQNLVGGQDELVFDGGSMVMNPHGKILARAHRFSEDLLIVDIPVRISPRRALKGAGIKVVSVGKSGLFSTRLPKFHRERRPDVRSGEEEVYRALVLGTRDYIQKNGFKKVLIGLSGGVDSALVARIAVDALGAENVVGVTMPSPYTSKETYEDAKRLARNLRVRCLELKINELFENYLRVLRGAFGARAANIAEENLQARIRGNILMALSNKFGYLVLTTGNKSEMATGYCTLYGDMAGGFAVIKDVPKTMVFKLARYRNSLSPQDSIPPGILKRPPSAELRPNQKDQDTLPPYAVLDRFLELYVEKDGSLAKIIRAGIPGEVARRAAKMVDGNEYKRRQSPPGVKITPKAFGRDRRMPITNRYLP